MKRIISIIILVLSIAFATSGQTKAETSSFLIEKIRLYLRECIGNSTAGYLDFGTRNYSFDEKTCCLTITNTFYSGKKCQIKWILNFSKLADVKVRYENSVYRFLFYFDANGASYSLIDKNKLLQSFPNNPVVEIQSDDSIDPSLPNRIVKAAKHLSNLCGRTNKSDNLFK